MGKKNKHGKKGRKPPTGAPSAKLPPDEAVQYPWRRTVATRAKRALPDRRMGASLTVIGDTGDDERCGALLVGGYSDLGALDDAWRVVREPNDESETGATWSWHRMRMPRKNAESPLPRAMFRTCKAILRVEGEEGGEDGDMGDVQEEEEGEEEEEEEDEEYIYLFGGMTEVGTLGDCWRAEIDGSDTLRWKVVEQRVVGRHAAVADDTAGGACGPCARYNHAMVGLSVGAEAESGPSTPIIVVHGGESADSELPLGDLWWGVPTADGAVEWRDGSSVPGAPPTPRCSHVAECVPTRSAVLFFGGMGIPQGVTAPDSSSSSSSSSAHVDPAEVDLVMPLNDVYVLQFEAAAPLEGGVRFTWSFVQQQGIAPSPRSLPGIAVDDTGLVHVFGGYGLYEVPRDEDGAETATKQLEGLDISATQKVEGSGSDEGAGSEVSFGYLDDLWAFDLESSSWISADDVMPPSGEELGSRKPMDGRNGHAMAVVDGQILSFGGFNSEEFLGEALFTSAIWPTMGSRRADDDGNGGGAEEDPTTTAADSGSDGEEEISSKQAWGGEQQVRLCMWEFGQNDVKRDSGSKLVRMGAATAIKIKQRFAGLVLDADAPSVVSPADLELVREHGIGGVNCSWNRIAEVPTHKLGNMANHRKLPRLLAANSVNYGKVFKMNTVEAMAATMYIVGFKEDAERVLEPFAGGSEFIRLNYEALEAYSSAGDEAGVKDIEERLVTAEQEFVQQRERRKQDEGDNYLAGMDLPPQEDSEEEEEEEEAED